MSVCSTRCSGLFVDVRDNLYCSQLFQHQVVRKSLLLKSSVTDVVAGTGCPGSTADMLVTPRGIFVTIDLDLYVADCGNDRVQLFRSGQTIERTVAGNGSTGTKIILDCPTGVVLDADGYLFVVDNFNNRIVGEGPWGFRCIVGCSGLNSSTSDKLFKPFTMSFDVDGNFFVTDRDNHRIQKFLLSDNTCGDQSTVSSILSSQSATSQ